MYHFNQKTKYKLPGLIILILVLNVILNGCAHHGITVMRVQSDFSYRKSQKSALTSEDPSLFTQQVIRQMGLGKHYQKNPLSVLEELDEKVCSSGNREILYSLSEISFLLGKENETRDRAKSFAYYMGVVRYSYYYLFDPTMGPMPNYYDPRFRNACELYNSSLAKCFKLIGFKSLKNDRFQVDFINRKMNINIKRFGFLWTPDDFEEYQLASDYRVRGLVNQFQGYGLGVPLIVKRNSPLEKKSTSRYFPDKPSFPVTAFLRVEGSMCDHRSSNESITLELYDPLRIQHINLGDIQVPLSADLTTPLGYYLSEEPEIFNLDIAGFLKIDKVQSKTGLYMLQPYEKGKIPVVMVHGLLSSPMTWVQMFNDLRGDPELRDKYQFWFFVYPTGNPYIYSASRLRDSLLEAQKTFDPDGNDPAFNEMVLIGHSMGGLLSRMMVIDSEDKFWTANSKIELDKIKASEEDKEIIKKVYFFKPLPFVTRVAFIATPQRGSIITENILGKISSSLVTLPVQLIKIYSSLLIQNPDILKYKTGKNLPTSIKTLSPKNPDFGVMESIPINPRVKYSSIIGNIKMDSPKELWTDGFVTYQSAHLEGAESEKIIPIGHRCLEDPIVILEIKDILRQHAHLNNSTLPVH